MAPTTRELVAELHCRHHQLIRSVIRSRVQHHDAEDIEQEVWLAAVVHLPRFRGKSQVQTWLVRIALNAVFMWGRRQRHSHWENLTTYSEPVVPPHSAEALDVVRVLHSLPSHLRAVLVWHEAYGLTHKEIARRLGIVRSTSVRRLAAARCRMRTALLNGDSRKVA